MTLIQPLLIALLVGAVIAYRLWMRSKLLDRAIVFGLAVAGIILTFSPNLSIRLAHAVGVGRGVDLVIYISLIGFGFMQLLVISKIRSLEAQTTKIVREMAVWKAETKTPGQ
jgi:hypothetical protein